jgi:hypothetical protein
VTNTQIALAGIAISSVGIGLDSISAAIFWLGFCLMVLAFGRFITE